MVRRARPPPPRCPSVFVAPLPRLGQPPRCHAGLYRCRRHCPRSLVVLSRPLAHTGCFRGKRLDSRLILMTYEVKPNDRGLTLLREIAAPPRPLVAAPRGTFDNFRTSRRANRIIFVPGNGTTSSRFAGLPVVYNLYYCSFRRDKEGRRKS